MLVDQDATHLSDTAKNVLHFRVVACLFLRHVSHRNVASWVMQKVAVQTNIAKVGINSHFICTPKFR